LSLIALIAASLAVWANVPEEPPLRHTHRELDLAIVGAGYFQLSDPDTGETCYTRRCRLAVNNNGRLVLHGTRFEIEPSISLSFPKRAVRITKEGRVFVDSTDDGDQYQAGQLQLAQFINVEGLEPVGHSVFRATNESNSPIVSSPSEAGAGAVQQGWLESQYDLHELLVNYAPLALAGIAAISLVLALTRRN
jgi:flagellar basal-body rod protein FlgG